MTLDSIKAVANPSTDCCGGIIPALQVQLSNQTPQAQLNLLGVGKEEVYFCEVLRLVWDSHFLSHLGLCPPERGVPPWPQ
jgi:hypothetical protein